MLKSFTYRELWDFYAGQHHAAPEGFDLPTLARGEAVYAASRVTLFPQNDAADPVRGEIAGSHGEVYSTTAFTFKLSGSQRAVAECTCRAKRDCKHGVALLMAWLEDRIQTRIAEEEAARAAPVKVLHDWVKPLRERIADAEADKLAGKVAKNATSGANWPSAWGAPSAAANAATEDDPAAEPRTTSALRSLREVRGTPVPHLWLRIAKPLRPAYGPAPAQIGVAHLLVEVGMGYAHGTPMVLRAMHSTRAPKTAQPRGSKPVSTAHTKLRAHAHAGHLAGGAPIIGLEPGLEPAADGHEERVVVLRDLAAESALRARFADLATALADIPPELIAARRMAYPNANTRTLRFNEEGGRDLVFAMDAREERALLLVHRLLPTLRKEGWQAAVQGRLPFTVGEVSSWQGGLAPNAGGAAGNSGNDRLAPATDWFAFTLGATITPPTGAERVEGEESPSVAQVNLAPVIAQMVAAGGFAAWRRTIAGNHDDYFLNVAQGNGVAQYVRLDVRRLEPLVATVADWLGEAVQRGTAEKDEREGVKHEPPTQLTLSPLAAAAIGAAWEQAQASKPSESSESAIDSAARALSFDLKLAGLGPTLQRLGKVPDVPPPASFASSLRSYQQHGFAWLQNLARLGLGGILADDMGLGKTVQTLAHLAKEQATKAMRHPALVVCPTSLIFNWQAEAQLHAPTLKVLALTGPERAQRFHEITQHDVVLTTYALLPRDADTLQAQPWHAIILDEAQNIKNAKTKAALLVRNLEATHRIALTGTPLENHLGELWSIADFAVPGLFGDEKAFRRHYRVPIEGARGGAADAVEPPDEAMPESTKTLTQNASSEDAVLTESAGTAAANAMVRERKEMLKRRLRPFLLRRTKSEVAPELPLKTEIVRSVALEGAQRDLYESVRAAMDERVRRALADAGLAKSHIVVLDALLKLRQVCCDPRLVKSLVNSGAEIPPSAKLEMLLELLPTLIEEGRTILLFSQFTSMLDLIEQAIDADDTLKVVPRVRLDGGTETEARRRAVERFQAGDAKLFLLSLKAGGVGLNLTAADTVIHYDPWWNPAVENQATDRAHRIGQDKPVFVYKLLTAGTVEEKIAMMQARKAELAAAVLTEDAAALGKALSDEDLRVLFG